MVASTASINLNLTVTGESEWTGIKGTLEDLRTALASLNKGQKANLPLENQMKALKKAFEESQAEVKQLKTDLASMATAQTNAGNAVATTTSKIKASSSAAAGVKTALTQINGALGGVTVGMGKFSTATLKATTSDKALMQAAKTTGATFDSMDSNVTGLGSAIVGMTRYMALGATVTDKLGKETTESVASIRTAVDILKKHETAVLNDAKAVVKSEQAASKATADRVKRIGELRKIILDRAATEFKAAQKTKEALRLEEKAIALVGNAQERLNALMKSAPVFAGSRQASGYRAIAAEMEKIVKSGQKISPEKVKQFMMAVDKAGAAVTRWANDMKTLAGRLTFFEQQMDAVLRASYRFKAAGADLTRFATSIVRGFQNVMTVFGDFDWNARRAAGAVGIFNEAAEQGGVGLDTLSEKIIKLSIETKLFPAKDMAEALYFWGSTTGQVIENTDQLTTATSGLSTMMKAAAITNTGYETTLKGVYSIISQFYAGDLTQATDITEKLFYVTQKTAAEFGDLINSFKMVGPVAASLGVTFESVLGTIGELADIGVRGTMAGRAIRQLFIQLVKPSIIAKQAVENVFWAVKDGFADLKNYTSYYDAVFGEDGNKYVGLTKQINILAEMTMNLDQQHRASLLATMSTANSLPILMTLVNKRVRELLTGVTHETKLQMDEAKDYFARSWGLLSESWRAVIGQLQRTWEGLKITIGASVATFMRPLVESLAEVIEKIREWAQANPEIIQWFAKLAGVAAVIAGIVGAVLTLTGAIMGLGAVAYVAVKSFGFTFSTLADSLKGIVTTADEVKSSFVDMARTGFGTLITVLGVAIGLMEAVQRNIEYIRDRFEEAARILSSDGGSMRSGIEAIAKAFDGFQQGIAAVFDLLVKRAADAVLVFTQIFDAVGKVFSAFDDLTGGALHLTDAIGGITKVLGALVAVGLVNKLAAFVPLFAKIKTGIVAAGGAMTAFGVTTLKTASLQGALGLFPRMLNAIRIGAYDAGLALKGMMASSGVGLLVVGLSILIEWLGSANASLDDLKSKTDASAAAFGEAADSAEAAARRIANATVLAGANSGTLKTPASEGLLADVMNFFSFGANDRIMAKANADYSKAINESYEAFHKRVEADTAVVIERWKGLVDDANQKFFTAGLDYHIDYGQFFDAYNAIDDIENIDNTQREAIALAIAAKLKPEFNDEQVRNVIAQAFKDAGVDLGNNMAELFPLLFNEVEHTNFMERAKIEENTMHVQRLLQDATATTVGEWLSFLKEPQAIFNGGNIMDIMTNNGLSDELYSFFVAKLQTVGDDTAENISNANFVGMGLENNAKIIAASLQSYIDNTFSLAFEELGNLTMEISHDLGSGNLAQVFEDVFKTQIKSLNNATLFEAYRDNTLPEQMREAVLKLMQEVASSSPEVAPLLKTLEDKSDLPDDVGSAVKEWMSSIKDSFISAIDGGIKKSYRTIKAELQKRLNNPEKYGDAASIKKLLGQLGSATLLYAMSQTTDTYAREQAFNFYNDNVVNPLMGGIEQAIANGNPERAQRLLQSFITTMATVPDYYWDNLDPDAKANMLSWLQTNYAGDLPPDLFENLTPEIEQGINGALSGGINITPIELKPSDLFSFGGTGNDERGTGVKGGATGGVGPAMQGIIPTPAQISTATTQIQSAMTTAVSTAVTNATASFIAAGSSMLNSVTKGWNAASGALTGAATTTVNALVGIITDPTRAARAYSGGFTISMRWLSGLMVGFTKAVQAAANTALAIARIIGNSPPKEGPLVHAADGGKSVGDAWGNALAKSIGGAKDKVNPHLVKLRNLMSNYRSQINQLMRGGLTEEEGYRKNYLEDLIRDLQWKMSHMRSTVKKGNGDKSGHKPDEPHVGDERGDATVTEVTKRTIIIEVNVSSKDGSVDRANQREIRRGVMDALKLADLQHMVTVG